MARRRTPQDETGLDWLIGRGEEAVLELLGNRSVRTRVAKAARRAAATKGSVDKNVEAVLHLFNLPSRADYQKLLVKLEHVQGSLVNLNMKLDRLLAARDLGAAKTKPPRTPEN